MSTTSPQQVLRRLHDDESAPNTVEWVLLIIVAMIVLAGIYVFVGGTKNDLSTQNNTVYNKEQEAIKQPNAVYGQPSK
jgi:Flp pilus assembly pilin Flp